MKLKKRIAALLMAGAMVCSTLPVNVLAVENSNQNVGGLCEHHTEHNADCGYTEGIEGRPCGYICGECDVEDEPKTATPSNAAQLSAGDVQKLIDALPATDKLTTMTKDERNAVYADLQAAYEAYQALTEDEQALLTGTEVFESLFHFFNGMVNLLATANGVSYLDENGDEQTADNVTVVESSMTTWNGGWYVVNNIVTIGSRVTVSGEVHLILADGASLTVNDGINVAEGNSFSVYAQSDSENMGALTATGVDFAAGIGGGSHGSGGNITISGGNVTASGGDGAAGIGNGKDSGSGGNIIIHGGSVKATGGQYAAGIGGGLMGSGGTITIHGGSVTANGGPYAAGIGGGRKGSGGSFATGTDGHALIVVNGGIGDTSNQKNWSGIIFEGDTGEVYGNPTIQENIEIPSGKTLTVPENTTLTVNRGVTLTNNGIITNNGTITNNGIINGSGTVGGNTPLLPPVSYRICDENEQNWKTEECRDYTVVDGSTTAWSDGWYVVNSNVTIGSRVTVSGEVHLILADGASLTANGGINVAESNSFSVYAQSVGKNMGTLTVTGGSYGAGIGGRNGDRNGSSCGNITINGGSVAATGGDEAAGIGGGVFGSGGKITINGGNVTATSGNEAAGIGGGAHGSGGNITINGGTVTATSVTPLGAGIGGGQESSGGNITINGGNVTATSEAFAAGIGGGQESSGGNITINGGTVTATGGPEGAGIGSGSHGSYDTITINGGSVTATGGELAAGIGGGIGDEIGGYGGSFTTGTDGHALIVASSISDKSQRDSWSGIIFEGDTGEVYGNPTIQENVEIPSGKTLTVPENTTLTVSSGVTLTNSGTITNSGIITNSGTITNNGTITGNGTLGGEGNLVGSGTVAPTITNNLQKDSAVSVTVSPSPATYGSKVNITATISRAATISKAANAITRAAENQVEFFVGTDSNKKSLGTANVSGDIATLSDVEISQEKGFAVGENTITAEYGGSMGLKPQTGSTRLTVQRDLKDAIVTVNGEYFYTNSPIIPEVSVTWNGTQLTKDTDYTVDYTDNTNAGKATVTVSGKGNYTGTKTEKFTIAPASYQITLAGRADSPTKITLDKAVVTPSDTGATITYGYSTTDATPTNWQMEREFTGLKAGTTYYFFAKATATANYAETISKGVAITTPEKTVSAIKISKQPNKLSYTSGQKLNLSGLSVQVNYKDNTNKTILWESGKLTAEPAQETVLTVANHNGKTITISYGGQTAQTDVLTVGKAEQATLSITGAPGKIYKGSSFTLQTSGGSGKGAVTWSVVSGSAKVDANGTVTVTDTGKFQIKAVKAEDAEYNQTEALITLTAVEKPDSSGGSSGSSGGSSGSSGGSSSDNGGSGGSTIVDRPTSGNPNTPTTGQTTPVKPTTNGNANINKSTVQQAIDKAAADAKKNGTTANGIAVVVPVNVGDTRRDVQIILKADTLDKLVSSKVKRFTIDTDRMADFDFTLDTLKELNRQTGGELILKIKKTVVSYQEAKKAIGSRPVYDITLECVKDGKKTAVNLNGETISVAIPYTPAKNEKTGNLYAVYVDKTGKVEWLTKSSYDADQKAVIFEAAHFSIYGVGYKNPVPNFTDINGHWAKEHILFTVSRGLFSGTSKTTFSPNTTLTRGMFVTALGRLAGIDPADYKNGKFTDVKSNAYYAPYVNWAASKGIVNGTGATTFAPDNKITREQMAVIMKNYADKMGYSIPKTLEAVTFADNAQISSWAKDAVKTMQQTGVLSGKANNLFDPKGNATRAEAATVLHRFVEVIIDPQSANGWQQNDSGEWSYYKDGEPVKGWLSDDQKWYWLDKATGKMFSGGWKQIDGKWYYFYADGSMAVSTKVDGYEVGADGARR
ncbi:MAG: hypothetical protein DBX51_03230 [Clostridiales bacterium]|nr:MAG: hypothetical protein DBX51_03230 [Clostridiales bacterium]